MQRFSPSALRAARQRAAVRQEQVALDIGRGVDVVRKYEAGQVDPPASIVAALAASVKCQPGDLFAEVDQ